MVKGLTCLLYLLFIQYCISFSPLFTLICNKVSSISWISFFKPFTSTNIRSTWIFIYSCLARFFRRFIFWVDVRVEMGNFSILGRKNLNIKFSSTEMVMHWIIRSIQTIMVIVISKYLLNGSKVTSLNIFPSLIWDRSKTDPFSREIMGSVHTGLFLHLFLSQ